MDKVSHSRSVVVLLWVVMNALLQGCAFHAVKVPPTEWVPQWSAEGRLAVRQNEVSRTANFKWNYRDQNHYSFKLFGPLGAYTNELVKTSRSARLITDAGEILEAETVEALSERVLGLRLPVQSMTWWARGKPDPNHTLTSRAETKGGITFTQNGWNIRVFYPSSRQSVDSPRKVILTRQQTRAVLVFHQWGTRPGDDHSL